MISRLPPNSQLLVILIPVVKISLKGRRNFGFCINFTISTESAVLIFQELVTFVTRKDASIIEHITVLCFVAANNNFEIGN
jgi:hypothetical protein